MFESNTAFVTGGTGSIGEAICNNFIKNNCAKVYASTTNLDKAKNLNKKINFINMDLKEISSNHLKDNINFEPDLDKFRLINPCGLNALEISSFKEQKSQFSYNNIIKEVKNQIALVFPHSAT